jgi:hypothetical protein
VQHSTVHGTWLRDAPAKAASAAGHPCRGSDPFLFNEYDASWLKQIEIYFSIVQRKALPPDDFPRLEAVAERLSGFERYYESIAEPFEWKFTRADLTALIARMRARYAQTQPLQLAA